AKDPKKTTMATMNVCEAHPLQFAKVKQNLILCKIKPKVQLAILRRMKNDCPTRPTFNPSLVVEVSSTLCRKTRKQDRDEDERGIGNLDLCHPFFLFSRNMFKISSLPS